MWAQSAGDKQPIHSKITDQRPKRKFERRWFVFFNLEMTNPGKAIADNWKSNEPKVVFVQNNQSNHQKGERGANKMQAPIGWVAMLSQVEWPKNFITVDLVAHENTFRFDIDFA